MINGVTCWSLGITTERRTGVSIRSTILRMDRLSELDEQGSNNVPEVLATSGGEDQGENEERF